MQDIQARIDTELELAHCILDFLSRTKARKPHIIIAVSPDVVVNIIGKNQYEEKKLNGAKLHYRGIHVVSDEDLPMGTCLAYLKH